LNITQSRKATKRDQDERETIMVSAPAMTSARMIGDGLAKSFVFWWLGVKKTLNITQNSPTTNPYRMG